MEAADLGRGLAARHREPAPVEPDSSVLNYAERTRAGGWSLRSALVRVAQPEPTRAGQVLESVRRCDRALAGLARELQRHSVTTDRGLQLDLLPAEPVDPHPDVRAADLARLLPLGPLGFTSALAAYQEAIETPLTDEEQLALPLLAVALELDALAESLAAWAVTARPPVPVELMDATVASTATALDALGIPRETGRPPRG